MAIRAQTVIAVPAIASLMTFLTELATWIATIAYFYSQLFLSFAAVILPCVFLSQYCCVVAKLRLIVLTAFFLLGGDGSGRGVLLSGAHI